MAQRDVPPEGYRTQSPGTPYWAERLLIDYWRSLAPWEKVRKVDDLCRAAHRSMIADLRMRHPDASDDELTLRAAALRLGDDVISRWTGFDARGSDADLRPSTHWSGGT